jgi:hypothetical protein
VHIGLASDKPVDLEITWPANGTRRTTRLAKIPVDGRTVLDVRVP